MEETEVNIPLSEEGKFIYGTLRGGYEHPLILLCHGYGGWMHEMLLFNAARFFEKKGFSTLRLSMYGGGENSRDIGQSDVMTHAADIDDVVTYLQLKGAKWVAVAGHSYSGMAIVYSAKQSFNAAALWDPTHTDGYDDPENIKNLENDFSFIEDLGVYVSEKGSGSVYAKTVFDNDYMKSNVAAKIYKIPTAVINASWSMKQQKYGKSYTEHIAAECEHIVIPGSSHPFTEDGAAEKMFDATAKYFKRQLKRQTTALN